AVGDREKVNFLNGFVRGGLINRRERRRLPLRLPVTYGGIDGPEKTFSRDLNEEGVFLLSDAPLPEDTVVHFVMAFPGRESLELKGRVTHISLAGEDDVPGMGVRFAFPDDDKAGEMKAIVDELETSFLSGALPDEIIS